MFWGLVLEPGKRYSTTVEKSFHVSKAVLDCTSTRSDNEVLSVILETEGSESLLCNLCKQKGILQESLDLNFMQGDRLTFECRGNGRIHLSGYLLPDDDDDEFPTLGGEEEESEEDEETEDMADDSPPKGKKEKRKLDANSIIPSKKQKINAEDDEDDEDGQGTDDDSDLSDFDLSGMEEEDDGEDEEEDDGEDDDEEESDEPVETPKQNKKHKNDKQKTPNNKQNQQSPKKTPVTNGVAKDQKGNKKTPGGDKSPNANAAPKQKQVLDHGVVVKDLKVGSGAPASKGKNVTVYYIGKLKDNNKVFDKSMKGEGFRFRLGKGEVIKGWDVGLQGMKVGGKRVIQCPPEAAYGAKGAPPKIPGNSSLIFEVELRSVN